MPVCANPKFRHYCCSDQHCSGHRRYTRLCPSVLKTLSALLLPAFFFFFIHTIYIPASGQAVVTGVVPSAPRFLPSIFIAHRLQQSHCLSIFHRVLLTHALALSASQIVHEKKSQRIYTSMLSSGRALTKLTYGIPGSRIT